MRDLTNDFIQRALGFDGDVTRMGLENPGDVMRWLGVTNSAAEAHRAMIASFRPTDILSSIGYDDAMAGQLASHEDSLRRWCEAESSLGSLGISGILAGFPNEHWMSGLHAQSSLITPELELASLARRFSGDAQRFEWFEDLLPTTDLVSQLGLAAWESDPFDVRTAKLFRDVIGSRPPEAVALLGRTQGLRVRKEIYRELGADPHVDRLPLSVIDASFDQAADEQSEDSDQRILIRITRLSPLTGIHTRCYQRIGAFETYLRSVVHLQMTERHGNGWIETIDSTRRSAWRRKLRLANGDVANATVEQLIAYAEWSDLCQLIDTLYSSPNWDSIGFRRRMADVAMIRNQAAHYRALVPADLVAVDVAIVEICVALEASVTPDNE